MLCSWNFGMREVLLRTRHETDSDLDAGELAAIVLAGSRVDEVLLIMDDAAGLTFTCRSALFRFCSKMFPAGKTGSVGGRATAS